MAKVELTFTLLPAIRPQLSRRGSTSTLHLSVTKYLRCESLSTDRSNGNNPVAPPTSFYISPPPSSSFSSLQSSLFFNHPFNHPFIGYQYRRLTTLSHYYTSQPKRRELFWNPAKCFFFDSTEHSRISAVERHTLLLRISYQASHSVRRCHKPLERQPLPLNTKRPLFPSRIHWKPGIHISHQQST